MELKNQLKLALKISTSNIDMIEINSFSTELRNLVRKLLSRDPIERPTAKEILNEPIFVSRETWFWIFIDFNWIHFKNYSKIVNLEQK